MSVTATAPAKVNLFLHVGPVQPDGYHPLASLVAFADVGDEVTLRPAKRLSLAVEGPFGAGLGNDDDNLILRALRALGEATGAREPSVAVTLDKRLPIAAGLGGGSSDAGAALRLARELAGDDIDDASLERAAATIGADGLMCLWARSAWASGRGDQLETAQLPVLHAVLANPGAPSPTGAVYRAYDAGSVRTADMPARRTFADAAGLTAWLALQRNDLEASAVALTPAIDEALSEVRALPQVRLARMSGSGATVFGLFPDAAAAATAAALLQEARPGWWTAPCRLG